MTTKTPAPQAISALLRKAGFTRAISKLRGGASGFGVSKLGIDAVEVRYASITMGTSNERRLTQLAKYAEAIEAAGFAVKTDTALPRLIVTTKAED